MFFLEPHLYADILQVPHRFQQIHRIPCESLNGLREDDVDLTVVGGFDHTLELIALGYPRAADSIVREHACILPVGIFLYQGTVVADLCGEGMVHAFGFH